jgi:uncharacterized protein (TIGR00255 family)
MISSMTGYGRVQQAQDGYSILFEVKSVNHRFFDFSARVPRMYGYLEQKLSAYLQQYVSRGKVEVFVTVDAMEPASSEIRLNLRLAESYVAALRQLQEACVLRDDISVSSVARFSDIFTVLRSEDDEEKVWNAVKAVTDAAMEGFLAMRRAEGARLREDILCRTKSISEAVDVIEARSPATVEEYRKRLTAKMNEILAERQFDETRIITEAAIYADKVSVHEETVRLKSHLTQFGAFLDADEPVGRKIDFLLQEMNREINTIGSKCADAQMARVVVDVKSELEKIREQIQNVE